MVQRKQYFDKLLKLRDKQVIKVVTGVRRCGKSTLLDLFRQHLLQNGIDESRIVFLNFEEVENEYLLDYKKLYEYVKERLCTDKTTYVFLDEIQLVPDFQKAVDSLYVKKNVDLYITGSNANLLSGELATLLSGRYVEIQMLPLSFAEYYEIVGGNRRDAFNSFFKNGSMPYAATLKDDEIMLDYLTGIYNTVLLKDIIKRKKFTDVALLETVIRYMFDNVGNIVSAKKIADSLTSYGRKTSSGTIDNYLTALCESFIMYEVGRYDVKGKQILKSLKKYYVVDIGFRRILLGNKRSDVGYTLENIVYLELLRRGYKVSIGKVDDLEVDFIAEKDDDRIYYQVSASVLDPNTYLREITPLKKINDNYPKFIISMDELPMNEDGIKQVNIIDFLLASK